MGVRVLLLAIVVNGAVAPAVASAAPSAPAAGLASTGTEDNRDALCELAGCCAGCLADPEGAARPIEHVLPDLSSARGFAAISDPFTEEHVRLPFRPPIAR
jgi:hypothetical protein